MTPIPCPEHLNLTLAKPPAQLEINGRRFLVTQPLTPRRYTLSDLCMWAAFSKFETPEELEAIRQMLDVYWTAHNEEAPKHGWIGVGCITFAEEALTEAVMKRPEIVAWIERASLR